MWVFPILFTILAVFSCLIIISLFHQLIVSKDGECSRLYELLFVKIPGSVFHFISRGLASLLTGDILGSTSQWCYLMMVFYLVLYGIMTHLFMSILYPKIYMILDNPEFHSLFCFIVIPCPVIILILLRMANPGNINSTNVDDYLKVYQYDSVLYHPAKCSHLLIPAVPRSRFCTFTNQRVARFDHYSPWVAQAIGERTLGLFVLFLFTNLSVFAYFCVICVEELHWKFDTTRHLIPLEENFVLNIFTVLFVLIREEAVVSGMAAFFMICSMGLLCLLLRQIWCISRNVTEPEIEMIAEEMKKRRQSGNTERIENVYDQGVFKNWLDIIFPPSR